MLTYCPLTSKPQAFHVKHTPHSTLTHHPPPTFHMQSCSQQQHLPHWHQPGTEDLILHFIQALERLGQTTAPQAPPAQIPTPATSQMHAWAPDTFDGMNPEDLQTFLLQCQITFNSCPQNFPKESLKVFFAISYLKKAALE